ncbi:MAG: tetratricopeptide repeat protein, partial [Deltaproteobacteria bacterium]|nr:tetratricopeptide repeat protein [Deltaproteobacteria bacterium]
VKAYGEALRRDEIYVDAYIGLANTFHRAGESERALRYLKEAVRLDPTNVAAWYNTGVVQDTLGRSGEAEKAYRQALEVDPHHAMSHNNLGSLLKRLDRRVEAERHFRLALKADPHHVEAKYNLAALLIDDQPGTSVLLLREVLLLQPDLVPARHNLAVALSRVDRPDEAMEQYAWLVEHNPKAPGVYLAMATLEANRGNTSEARRLVRQAVEVGGPEVTQIIASDPVLRGLGG